MTYTYMPQGVCSRKMTFELDGTKVRNLYVEGGCHGNLQGVARLVEGMEAEEAISRLRGVRCGFKSTSCPDQLAVALEKALAQK